MDEPFLTIGIATLDRPKYLGEAIQSVVNAAKRCECRIQLVVSDMGGHEASAHAFQRASHDAPAWLDCQWLSDTRIPSGIANWEACLNQARGHYYMMIGDDDRLVPDAIYRLRDALEQPGPKPAGLLASARDIDAIGAHRRTRVNPRRRQSGRDFLTDVVTRRLHLRWCAFVARTDILRKTRPFAHPFPGGGGAADGAAIISAALAGDILTLDLPISEFRVHGGNDSRSISIEYQRTQRHTLEQFVHGLPLATAADHALVALWLGGGVRYQCLRWAAQGLLDLGTLNELDQLAQAYLRKASVQPLSLNLRAFGAVTGVVVGVARILTCLGRAKARSL